MSTCCSPIRPMFVALAVLVIGTLAPSQLTALVAFPNARSSLPPIQGPSDPQLVTEGRSDQHPILISKTQPWDNPRATHRPNWPGPSNGITGIFGSETGLSPLPAPHFRATQELGSYGILSYKTEATSVLNAQFATFVVHWDHQWCPNSTDFPQEAKDALLYALNLAGAQISSTVPIDVGTCWRPQCPLGEAGVDMLGPGPNIPPVDYWYPVSLTEALAGQDLYDFGERGDFQAYFGSDLPWYFGTDGNTPPDKYDFVTVALHEIVHALGFAPSIRVKTEPTNPDCGGIIGNGCWGFPWGWDGNPISDWSLVYPYIFDRFVSDSSGARLINTSVYSNPGLPLGSTLQGANGGAYFVGPNAVLANGGNPVQLSSPQPGHLSQLYHNTPDDLMITTRAMGESTHTIGPVTLGLLKDLGWIVPALMLTPTITTEVHDAGHNVITSATIGSSVHDKVSVSGSGVTPTGSATFKRYTALNCTGSSYTQTVSLNNGSAESNAATVPSTGMSYSVSYAGDTNYNPATGTCEPLAAENFKSYLPLITLSR